MNKINEYFGDSGLNQLFFRNREQNKCWRRLVKSSKMIKSIVKGR